MYINYIIESLNVLESMVMEKFSEIKDKNVQMPHWPREPYDYDQYGQKMVPVKDLRSLTISFTTEHLTQYKSAVSFLRFPCILYNYILNIINILLTA